MRDERLEVSVTFDERRGYIGTAPELRQPVLALSLGGLRRKIEIALRCAGASAILSAVARGVSRHQGKRSWTPAQGQMRSDTAPQGPSRDHP